VSLVERFTKKSVTVEELEVQRREEAERARVAELQKDAALVPDAPAPAKSGFIGRLVGRDRRARQPHPDAHPEHRLLTHRTAGVARAVLAAEETRDKTIRDLEKQIHAAREAALAKSEQARQAAKKQHEQLRAALVKDGHERFAAAAARMSSNPREAAVTMARVYRELHARAIEEIGSGFGGAVEVHGFEDAILARHGLSPVARKAPELALQPTTGRPEHPTTTFTRLALDDAHPLLLEAALVKLEHRLVHEHGGAVHYSPSDAGGPSAA
jgi:hypothetical protein